MKKLSIAVAIACGVAASASHAAVYTFEYTGTIGAIQVTSSPTDFEWVAATSLPGFAVAVGETVTGTFTYDTTAAVQWQQPGEAAYGMDGKVTSALTFGASGHQYAGAPATSFVNVSDSAEWGDAVNVYGSSFQPGGGTEYIVHFGGNSSAVLASAALPGWALTRFEQVTFDFATTLSGQPYPSVLITGNVSSVRLVSPVPEPATYTLLLAGLGLLGWRRARA